MTAISEAGGVETFPEPAAGSPANGDHEFRRASAAPDPAPENLWIWGWLLWERRRFLALALSCGLAASLALALIIPKQYQSTMRLMPPDGQSGSSLAMLAARGGSGMGAMAGSLLGLRGSGALFLDILRSRTVEDRIVGRFDLRRTYGERYWIDARRRLDRLTEIAEDRKSQVITIRVNDRDPRRAAEIAQAYVDELDHLVAEVSTSSARRERIFIKERLISVKRDLDRASEEFSQFASQNATLDISSQGKSMVEAAGRLQGELIASRSELQGLEQVYAPNNFRVRSLRARVEELRKQLGKLDGDPDGVTAPTSDAGRSLSQQRGSSPDASSGSFPSIRQLPILGVRWQELYLKTKIEETVYELLTQQYEMAKIEEAKELPAVKILDAADIPEKKSSPQRSWIVLAGGFLFLSLAATWVIGERIWDQADDGGPGKQLSENIVFCLCELPPVRWLRVRGERITLRPRRLRR